MNQQARFNPALGWTDDRELRNVLICQNTQVEDPCGRRTLWPLGLGEVAWWRNGLTWRLWSTQLKLDTGFWPGKTAGE